MGATWDKDTDYQAIINDAVKKGDYKTAAQAEQQRNAKISGLGLNYDTTSNYAGWLDTTDYGTIGKQQMASGASAADVLDTYNKRYNKAANTVGLTQYANDEIQQQMMDYVTANMNTPAAGGYSMPTYSYDVAKPTYTSNYQTGIDALLAEVLGREKFSYNAEDDPLYQQYKTQYNREGNRAMNDTLASVASGAGGMNSYAVTAAQQANNYYASQLADKIPELQQLAYEMYMDDIGMKRSDLGLLMDLDNTQYGRYRDDVGDWYKDRDFTYGQYRDNVGDYKWSTEFDYNVSRDKIADERYDTEWQHKLDREEVEDGRYDTEWQHKLDREGVDDDRYTSETAWNNGYVPPVNNGGGGTIVIDGHREKIAKETGLTPDMVNVNPDDLPIRTADDAVNGLGIGPVSDEVIMQLTASNAIKENEDGSLSWINGWNAKNWRQRLDDAMTNVTNTWYWMPGI